MSRIVGGIGTSHIPAIGLAMARKQSGDPYWRSFFEAYLPVRRWLESVPQQLLMGNVSKKSIREA